MTLEEERERQRVYRNRWAAKNRERIRAKDKLWRQKNPGKNAAKQAAYHAAKLQRTPPWADMDAIREAYEEAAHHSMQVDHIIPLRGELVSGLHVWDNLQLLSAEDNQSKSNNYTLTL